MLSYQNTTKKESGNLKDQDLITRHLKTFEISYISCLYREHKKTTGSRYLHCLFKKLMSRYSSNRRLK
jgi:hypothetical protein